MRPQKEFIIPIRPGVMSCRETNHTKEKIGSIFIYYTHSPSGPNKGDNYRFRLDGCLTDCIKFNADIFKDLKLKGIIFGLSHGKTKSSVLHVIFRYGVTTAAVSILQDESTLRIRKLFTHSAYQLQR